MASRGGNSGGRKAPATGLRLRPAAWVVLLAFCQTAGATPSGASVAAGSAQFQTSGNALTITNAPGTIITWQQFSIAAGEHTRFEQQSAASAVLNRVAGGDPSGILGTLSSNGRVFLVNPSGIVFGKSAVIDTAGFIASTLNITDQDFLEGRLRFEGGGGALRNEGAIRAGGDIFLVGPRIENAGLVRSEGGSVVLAAGKSVTITGPDAQGVQFALQAPADTALNLGRIEATNAVGLFAGTLRHSGDVRVAAGVDGVGRVVLSAQGDAILDGNATISTDNAAGRGGSVQILGERVGLADKATVSASGATGGGEILLGGDYKGGNPAVRNAQAAYVGPDTLIRADATEKGDGGKVIVWSDEATRAYGSISARGGAQGGDGGFVETSGAYLDVTRTPDATAPKGRGGQWLLDPNNIDITNLAPHPGGTNVAGNPDFTTTDDGAQINPFTIQQALDAGTSVTITTGTAGANSEVGNINISDGFTKAAGGDATLTLTAHNNIYVNNSITSTSGRLNMIFNAGDAVALTGNNPTLDANGGSIAINGNSSVWGNLLGVLINNSTVSVAGDFWLGGGATLDVQNGSTLAVGGKFYFSDGTLRTVNGTGSTTVTGGVYISGNGTKTLGGTHVLTNNGTGEWSGSGGFELNGTFNNAGTLKILKDDQLFNMGGTFNNSGTFWKTDATAGTTTIWDAVFNNTGTVKADAGALQFTYNTVNMNGGALTTSGGATVGSYYGTFNWNGGTLTSGFWANGTFNITGSGDRVLDGLNLSLSDLNLSGGSLTVQSGSLTATGTTTVAPGATLAINGGSFGTGGGTVNVAGVFEAGAGAIDVGTLNVAAGGTLRGTGTVVGNVANNGTVAAGASPGTLTIDGNYAQGAGGTLSVELGGTNQGVDYDLLRVTGTATLDGALGASLVGGFAAAPGDAFDVMSYASRSGDFAALNYPAGYAFQASADATIYRLAIPAPVVAPSPAIVPSSPPSPATVPNDVSPNLMLAMLQTLPGTVRQEPIFGGEEDRAEQACRP